ncbi:UDP-3-O-(3-hydroxymyristoyl)glucosamine N-acyltransferase [candidate division KSB1 bacterium]|nr:UDP-3-O-(3-hydroxymyristoyl)glucosamine N-acyltransferase [candidate division KSB1 bacterium]
MIKQKSLTLNQICQITNGRLSGDGEIVINRSVRLDEAKPGDLTFIAAPKYAKNLENCQATALIVYPEFNHPITTNLIYVADPFTAFFKVVTAMTPATEPLEPGIHPTAIIAEGTTLGENIAIGPYVIIGKNCQIAENVQIYAGTTILNHVDIGANTRIYQNVSIREGCVIGERVIIHPGAVIGADGFGFRNLNGTIQKIPQLGYVIIEDDVEIGANTCVDRAIVGATRIGKGSKLDNLVQIAHNVVIGENTVIAGQAGIAGSSQIGNGVVIAGQVGIADHIKIGDFAILAAQAGITKDVAPKIVVSGYPAREHFRAKREEAVIRNLPELSKLLSELKKRVAELESITAKLTSNT